MKKALVILLIIVSLLSSNPVSAQPAGFTEIQIYNAPPGVSWGATYLYINDLVFLAFIQTFEKSGVTFSLNTAKIYVSKTIDGGATWSEARLLLDPVNNMGAIMPNPVYSPANDKVFLLYSYWNGESQLWMMESADKGETFFNQRRLLPDIFYPLPSNAAGITLNDGTLVFPIAYYKRVGYYQSAALFSNNLGQTWQMSSPIDFAEETGNGSDEPAMVQLTTGALLAYVRTNQGYVGQSLSYDIINWTPVTRTDFQTIGGGFDGQQVEARFIDGKMYLAYSGASRDAMNVGTLRMSENNGETFSDPINFEDGIANKSSFHISKMGAHQAILSWWEFDGIELMGRAVIFDPNVVFAKPVIPEPPTPYLPPFDRYKREFTPQPVPIVPDPYVPPVY